MARTKSKHKLKRHRIQLRWKRRKEKQKMLLAQKHQTNLKPQNTLTT